MTEGKSTWKKPSDEVINHFPKYILWTEKYHPKLIKRK